MPYINKPRPYKKEYQQQLRRNEVPKQMKRQEARRTLDAKGIDRTGKEIDHITPISKGGTNAPSNLRLVAPNKNHSFSRNPNHTVKKNKPTNGRSR